MDNPYSIILGRSFVTISDHRRLSVIISDHWRRCLPEIRNILNKSQKECVKIYSKKNTMYGTKWLPHAHVWGCDGEVWASSDKPIEFGDTSGAQQILSCPGGLRASPRGGGAKY